VDTNADLSTVSSVAELTQINLGALKASEVGLSLLLLNIAQREAKRIQKLASFIDLIEDEIFDTSVIQHLSPSEQIQRYTLALQSTQQSSTYINSAIKSINWGDIETKILILSQENKQGGDPTISANNTDLQAAAMRLLSQLSSNTTKA